LPAIEEGAVTAQITCELAKNPVPTIVKESNNFFIIK
jgi:hypothetical protein